LKVFVLLPVWQMNGAYMFLADQSREGFPKSTDSSNLQRPPEQQQSNMPLGATAAMNASKTAGAAAVGHWHLQHLEQLPWDWSLKQWVRLASAQPFALLEEQWGAGLETGEKRHLPDCPLHALCSLNCLL
jgi:hypothetical protein